MVFGKLNGGDNIDNWKDNKVREIIIFFFTKNGNDSNIVEQPKRKYDSIIVGLKEYHIRAKRAPILLSAVILEALTWQRPRS